jgi:heme exporter protein D
MAAEGIVNFDSYAWLAVGLFITGLLAVMVYEKSSSKTKQLKQEQQQQQQQKRQEVGSSSDIKRE